MSETNILNEERVESASESVLNEAPAATVAEYAPEADGERRKAPEAPVDRAYTADEVRAMVQSESDRRVSGARAKWERDLAERVEAEANARAAQLTAAYAERIAELEGDLAAERERSERRERRLAIGAALDAAGLPSELAALVEGVAPGGEAEAIAAVKSAVDERAAAQCARRVASKAPAAGEAKRTLTPSEILSLPVARLSELMKG